MQEEIHRRPDGAAAIWDWREVEAPPEPRAGAARLRGALQALAGGVIGGLVYTFWSRTAGTVVLSIASFILLAACLSPRGLFALIEGFFEAVGQVLGRVLNTVILAIIFYGFFLPFGLFFRRGRRDPMKRFYESESPSYWSGPQRARSGSSDRSRQY